MTKRQSGSVAHWLCGASLPRWLLAIRGLLLAGVIAGAGLGFLGVSGCMEFAFYYPDRTPFETQPNVEDVHFRTADGLTLHGWYLPPRNAPEGGGRSPAVVHVHGNAGNVATHVEFCHFLADAGVGVLVFDYRSYGRSDPATRRLRRSDLVIDTHAAIDALLQRPDVDPERVGVYGFSLGGVLGLAAAAERDEVRAVAVGAPFATWQSVAADHGGLLGPLLVRPGADALDAVTALGDRPLLIVHGTDDRIVGPHHAERIAAIAEQAGVRTSLRLVEGEGHEGLLLRGEVRELVAEFFRRELGAEP